jgi:hypothetical protein
MFAIYYISNIATTVTVAVDKLLNPPYTRNTRGTFRKLSSVSVS